MAPERLQRTLLVGLGEVGAQTVDLVLANLARRFGEIELVQGLAVLTEAIPLDFVETSLLIVDDPAFSHWRGAFEQQVELTLRDMSQLARLSRLRQKRGEPWPRRRNSPDRGSQYR